MDPQMYTLLHIVSASTSEDIVLIDRTIAALRKKYPQRPVVYIEDEETTPCLSASLAQAGLFSVQVNRPSTVPEELVWRLAVMGFPAEHALCVGGEPPPLMTKVCDEWGVTIHVRKQESPANA